MPKGSRNVFYRHGYSAQGNRAPEYYSWVSMRDRTCNPNSHAAARYSERGIICCPRWSKFENFIYDMGDKPGPEMTLEREDNNKGYSPCNCYWATKSAQMYNTSATKLSLGKAEDIRKLYAIGDTTMQTIADTYGASLTSIFCVIHNKTWRTS